MPKNAIACLDERGCYIAGTVYYNSTMYLTTDQELLAYSRKCRPVPGPHPFELSEDGLIRLFNEYCLQAGTSEVEQKKVAAKYEANQHDWTDALPFYWSFVSLMRCLDENNVDLTDVYTNTAFMRFWLFNEVHKRWCRHPDFSEIISDLKNIENGLFHTIGQLIVAAHLSDAGNIVGFEQNADGGRPDLYLRANANDTLYIECKAPKILVSDIESKLSYSKIQKLIRKKLNSRNQLTSENPGLLAIVCHDPFGEIGEFLSSAIGEELSRAGTRHSHLLGVVIVKIPAVGQSSKTGKMGVEVQITTIQNKRCQYSPVAIDWNG